jgi:hypothetical protein
MTDITVTWPTAPLGAWPGTYRKTSDWIGRVQAELSDSVHADGDTEARALGWEITTGTGTFGFGDRTYHDRRWTTRRKRMVRSGQRRPITDLAVPRGRVRVSEHLR